MPTKRFWNLNSQRCSKGSTRINARFSSWVSTSLPPALVSPYLALSTFSQGDVGAGKSLFLNLLLREKILPTTARHCTPTICEIEYSSRRSLLLYPHNQGTTRTNALTSNSLSRG